MRLLNVQTLKLETFFGALPPRYAILSHTWEEEEVLYADIQDPAAPFPTNRLGASKVKESCEQAKRYGFDYIWIDTCCIDKTSSAELSESINSMFAWYRQADICFAYLADIDTPNATSKVSIEKSRWFTRGWTLQELLAPRQVIFYNNQWSEIGRREPDAVTPDNSLFLEVLVKATGIPSSILCRFDADPCGLSDFDGEGRHDMRLFNGTCQVCSRKDTFPVFLNERFSNAQKMSWAARRVTTRREDQAYCLLGLFSVNMSLLYGEGDNAFLRLQEEIIRKSDDASLLAFNHSAINFGELQRLAGNLLAPSAHYFEDSPIRLSPSSRSQSMHRITVDSKTIGLRLFICPDDGRSKSQFWLGILPSCYEDDLAARPALLLKRVSYDDTLFIKVLVREITVRPVITEINIKQNALVDASFNLLNAQLQDIRIVRKKAINAVYPGIPPLLESPAVRIFIQKGIRVVRIHPEDLGHEMVVRMSPHLTEPDRIKITLNTDGTDGTMIYIPARDRGELNAIKWSNWDPGNSYTFGVLCLEAEGETKPFYVVFYGLRSQFRSMHDPSKGVSGTAAVQVDLKPENGDPASPGAMEAALRAELRMQRGSANAYKQGKRVILRRVEFLDQIILELRVEADVKIAKISKEESS